MKLTIFLTLLERHGPDEVPDEWVLALLDGAKPPETKSVRDIAREAADEAQLAWVRVRNLEPKPKPVPPPSSGTETWQEQTERTGSMPTWAQSKVDAVPEPEPEPWVKELPSTLPPNTPTRTVKVTWDTEGYSIDVPSLVEVPVVLKTNAAVCSWLCDEYGWLVEGWADADTVPTPEPGTVASMSKHWEDGTGPYADCGGEKGRRKTKTKPKRKRKTKGNVPCRSGRCPCEVQRGVRCENPVVRGTRRCKEHTGKSLGFSLSRAQRKLLIATGQKESIPVHGKVALRSVYSLQEKGLITYAPPRSASKSGRVTITEWGSEVLAGLRFW